MTDKTMTLEQVRDQLLNVVNIDRDQLADAITRHLSQPAGRGEAVARVRISESGSLGISPLPGMSRTLRHGQDLYTATPPAAGVLDENEASVAAIQFALTAEDGFAWLRLWNEGDFEACRREWPEAPSQCYVGADPLLSATPSPTIDVAAVREVIEGMRCVSRLAGENDLRLRDTCAGASDKLARAIGDAK